MLLQLAIDLHRLPDALALLEKVGSDIDVIEIGTPLVKNEGLAAVRAIKDRFPTKQILADMKTMDAGALEARLAFDAGADIVTVLALANDATIRGAVDEARALGRLVVADLIGVADMPRRAITLSALGVTAVEVHAGLDEQAQGKSPFSAAALVRAAAPDMRIAVAGGVNPSNIARLAEARADVAVCGAAIYASPNPRAAVEQLRANMPKASPRSTTSHAPTTSAPAFTLAR